MFLQMTVKKQRCLLAVAVVAFTIVGFQLCADCGKYLPLQRVSDVNNASNNQTFVSDLLNVPLKLNTPGFNDTRDDWPSEYNGPGVCGEHEYGEMVTDTNHKCRRLPDVVIAGFEKCGTMSVLRFLGVHPDIIETSYEHNFQFFSSNSKRTYCEFSQQTSCTPSGKIKASKIAVVGLNSEKVFKFKPDMRIIFVVRDPVERTMSNFVHIIEKENLTVLNPTKVFSQTVSHILENRTTSNILHYGLTGFSLYVVILQTFLKYFPMKHIHIVDGDEFVKNPATELKKIETFLKLQKHVKPTDFVYDPVKQFFCMNKEAQLKCMPPKKGRVHPRMLPRTKQLLKQVYMPYNKEFYTVVGKQFRWDDI